MSTTIEARNVDAVGAAAILGVSRSTIYNLARRAHDPLPAYRINRRVVFDSAEVRAWKRKQGYN